MSDQPSPDYLKDLFDNAPCGYLVLDATGSITDVNVTFSRWIGYPSKELMGRKLASLLNMSGRVFYETHFLPLLHLQGHASEVALDFKKSDGERLAVLVSAADKRDDDNQTILTRITIFQAAQRRQYERELVKAKATADATVDNLSTANASLTDRIKIISTERDDVQKGLLVEREVGELREQFVAVLGHDLRNPLASMMAALRLISKEVTSDRGNQVLHLMDGSAKRMSALIDNVLDFARGRLGGGIGLDRNADELLEPIIRQVVNELRTGASDRVIIEEIAIDGGISFDRGRVGQLLSNLLGNAISHGKPDLPIFVRAITLSGHLELSVSNGGDRIAADAMERLFEPFVRGQARGYKEGLGLGLHIASEIAKAHGGTLTVVSSDDETRFTFRMPLLES